SVSVEMALKAPKGHVYAVEKKDAAADLIEVNGKALGASNVTVVRGTAPAACEDLPAPTHVFIGGSSGNMKEIIALALSKSPDARIVATAVTLESVSELASVMKEFGPGESEAVLLSVSRDRKAGPYHLMNALNPVYIFTMQHKSAEGGAL
ncbi:MAG: bifunctional cobalt-precorrin-7 (C(5))-methyltransferase/cobalt-precorrin-6B (C(15))-methyltransferase, partial [Firmicutes bacterium]|nr:bifunctional cobalt-precorrin-7 (C(5))-methyltransferase/cobalt-precorrin-6B (C(15))-methyltransferase [Bacillota bacterium]